MYSDDGFGFHSSSAHHSRDLMLQVDSPGLAAPPVVTDPLGHPLRC